MTAGWRRWRRIWQHAPERDVDAELRFHLDERIAELTAAGADADHARAQALREFGDMPQVRDRLVDIDQRITRRRAWRERFEWVGQDLSYVVRSLRRSPGFVVAVVATLALGIGANAAVFSFLDQLFLRPPAGVAHPADVHRIYRSVPPTIAPHAVRGPPVVPQFDYPEVRALRASLPASFALAGYRTETVKLGHGNNATDISAAYVDGPYFTVLGVRPLAGRMFTPDELRPETPAADVVISAHLWQSRFGSAPDVIGSTVDVDNHPFVIIGVAGGGFRGPDLEPVDVWLPMNTIRGFVAGPSPWYDAVYAFTIWPLARASTTDSIAMLRQRAQIGLRTGPLADDSVSQVMVAPLVVAAEPGADRSSLTIATRLAGVALIILLIAVANVTNLLLARGMHRRREISVRLALGVSRARLVRLLVLETTVLATLAGAVALLSALWIGAALRHALLPGVHWAVSPIDGRIVGLTVLLVAGSVTAAGLFPALRATRPDLAMSLKTGARDAVHRRSAARHGLLIIQASLSVLLLVGAGIFVRSLHSVETEDIGYQIDRVVTASEVSWDDGDHGDEFVHRFPAMLAHVQHLPGVEAAGTGSVPVMRGVAFGTVFRANGDSIAGHGDRYLVPNDVSPDFFAASGIRVLLGRGILASDRLGSAPVLVVNQTMARALWPGQSAIGQCLKVSARTNPCRQIVGVVADARLIQLIEAPSMQFYVPTAQDTVEPSLRLVIRAAPGRADAVASEVRVAIRAEYGDGAIAHVQTLSELLAPEFRPWRLGAALFSAAGLLALLVAMVGVYSTIAYTFSQRTHEIGVRMALGARAALVARLVIGDGLRIVAIGVAIGLVLSLAGGQLVASMLYHVSPHDPLVLVSVSIVLLLVAALACAIPAWRASRVDPVIALRAE